MQNRNFIPVLSLLSLVILLGSCEPDEKAETKPFISARIDGKAAKFEAGPARIFNRDDFRSLNFSGVIDGEEVFFSVSGYDFRGHPPSGVLVQKYYTSSENEVCGEDKDGVTKCDGATVCYYLISATSTDDYCSGLVTGYEGYVEITSFDDRKMKVSGRFHAKVANFDEVSKIVEGEFKDLPYIILD